MISFTRIVEQDNQLNGYYIRKYNAMQEKKFITQNFMKDYILLFQFYQIFGWYDKEKQADERYLPSCYIKLSS